MKKFLPLALIALLAFSFMVGCDDDDDNGPVGTTFTFRITSITATPDSLEVGQVSALTCEIDYSGDEMLQYQWTAPYGDFLESVEGPSTRWRAPEDLPTYHRIKLAVTAGDTTVADSTILKVVPASE